MSKNTLYSNFSRAGFLQAPFIAERTLKSVRSAIMALTSYGLYVIL